MLTFLNRKKCGDYITPMYTYRGAHSKWVCKNLNDSLSPTKISTETPTVLRTSVRVFGLSFFLLQRTRTDLTGIEKHV